MLRTKRTRPDLSSVPRNAGADGGPPRPRRGAHAQPRAEVVRPPVPRAVLWVLAPSRPPHACPFCGTAAAHSPLYGRISETGRSLSAFAESCASRRGPGAARVRTRVRRCVADRRRHPARRGSSQRLFGAALSLARVRPNRLYRAGHCRRGGRKRAYVFSHLYIYT